MTAQLQTLATIYEQYISPILQHGAKMVPMYSTVTSQRITHPTQLDVSYWGLGLSSPVLFSQAMETVLSDFRGHQLALVEIGTHCSLAGVVNQIVQDLSAPDLGLMPSYIPTLTRNDPDTYTQLFMTVGRLHLLGITAEMSRITGIRECLCDLPSYPWQRRLHRSESRLARDWRLRPAPHHELIGSRITAMPEAEPAWRNLLQLGDVLWLGDHVLGGKVIFPVAAFIAMAGAACAQLCRDGVAYSVRDLVLKSFLTLLPGTKIEILTSLKKMNYNDLIESEWYSFSIASYDGTSWTKHCKGQVRAEEGDPEPSHDQHQTAASFYPRRVNAEQWYASVRKHGYEYGRSFQGLDNVSADPVHIAAAGTIDETASQMNDAAYFLHPAAIDKCLQVMGVAQCHGLPRRLNAMEVPKSVEHVSVARASQTIRVHVRGVQDENQNISWNASAVSNQQTVLSIRNMRCAVMGKMMKENSLVPPLTTLRWIPLLDLLSSGSSILSKPDINATGKNELPWSKFLTLLAHSRPSLRVLEIGVGAPDVTKSNLEILKTSEGTRLFSSYTLTGSSASSLDQPKIQFDGSNAVSFKVYDVLGEIEGQGLEENNFDLIVTSDASQILSPNALASVQRLLTDSGWLLIQQSPFPVSAAISPVETVTCAATRLHETLIQAQGFELEDTYVQNVTEGGIGVQKLTMLAKAAPRQPEPPKKIVLLASSDESASATTIAHELTGQGYSIEQNTLEMAPEPGQFILSVLDLEGCALGTLAECDFEKMKKYLLSCQARHILWLTKTTHIGCRDPTYGLIHGLARTLRRECGLDLSVLEIDNIDEATSKLIVDVQWWIERAPLSHDKKRDSEFAILDGRVHVGRYHWIQKLPPSNSSPLHAGSVLRLDAGSNPSEKKCTWASTELVDPLESQVQVKVHYVGLNFRVRLQSLRRSHRNLTNRNRMFWSQPV